LRRLEGLGSGLVPICGRRREAVEPDDATGVLVLAPVDNGWLNSEVVGEGNGDFLPGFEVELVTLSNTKFNTTKIFYCCS
jgi:hypothetical protein